MEKERIILNTNEVYISLEKEKLKAMTKVSRVIYITDIIKGTLGKKELPQKYESIIEGINKQIELTKNKKNGEHCNVNTNRL
jgi:hypothetical protein